MWDYNVGLVRVTPFFKSCRYSKVGDASSQPLATSADQTVPRPHQARCWTKILDFVILVIVSLVVHSLHKVFRIVLIDFTSSSLSLHRILAAFRSGQGSNGDILLSHPLCHDTRFRSRLSFALHPPRGPEI